MNGRLNADGSTTSPATDSETPEPDGASGSEIEFGLALDFRVNDAPNMASRLRSLEPLLRQAENLGYASISAGESYVFDPSSPMAFHAPNSLMMLAAVANVTQVPRLLTAALLVPGWQRLRLAYDAALVDQLSDGRLVLGLGLGSPEAWRAFGIDYRDAGKHLERTITSVRSAWAGNPLIRTGQSARQQVLDPGPLQPGGPPILVGGGVPASARRAARLADGYTGSTGYTRERIRRLAGIYHSHVQASMTGQVVVNRLTLVGQTDTEARDLARRYLSPLLRAYKDAGVLTEVNQREEVGGFRQDVCIVGSPDTVAKLVGEYAKDGVTSLQLRVAPAGTPIPVALQSAQLFAEEVMPKVRAARGAIAQASILRAELSQPEKRHLETPQRSAD